MYMYFLRTWKEWISLWESVPVAFLFTKISWESTASLGPKSWRFPTNAAASLLRFAQGRYVMAPLGCFVKLSSDIFGKEASFLQSWHFILSCASDIGLTLSSALQAEPSDFAEVLRDEENFNMSSSTTSWHSLVFPHPGWKQFTTEIMLESLLLFWKCGKIRGRSLLFSHLSSSCTSVEWA